MSMEDGLGPDHPLPPFLAHRLERQGIQQASERAVTSSRVFKASILIAAATAIGIVVLSVGDPGTLVAAVTTSLVGNSGPQPDTDQPVSTFQSTPDAPALVQSTADAQASPPTADVPPRYEIAAAEPAAAQPAGQDQAEKSELSSEVLFRQFQAWTAEQDAQAKVRPAQPIQDASAQVVQNAPARVAENATVPHHRLRQKHRHVVPVHTAQAEHFRKKVRRVQTARVEPAPTQDARAERTPIPDARAQNQAVQNTQAPSFLPIFGLRN